MKRAPGQVVVVEEMKQALTRFGKLAAKTTMSADQLTRLWNEYVLPGITQARYDNERLDEKLSRPL